MIEPLVCDEFWPVQRRLTNSATAEQGKGCITNIVGSFLPSVGVSSNMDIW